MKDADAEQDRLDHAIVDAHVPAGADHVNLNQPRKLRDRWQPLELTSDVAIAVWLDSETLAIDRVQGLSHVREPSGDLLGRWVA